MKTLLYCALLICATFSLKAATNITTPSVSGHWTTSGSPYLIYNSINVAPCATLIIDPGVEVIFQGYYGLSVSGSLITIGTAAQPILFHVSDTSGWSNVLDTLGGWKGITWANYSCTTTSDSTIFTYCDVSDVKALNVISGYRSSLLQYCSFHHNIGSFAFPTTPGFEMANCSVYNSINHIDTTTSGGVLYYTGVSTLQFGTYGGSLSGLVKIHDCNIHDNQGNTACVLVNNTTLQFYNNNVYGNVATDKDASVGTIYIRKSICTVNDNKIYNNIDGEDAAIHAYSCDVTIDRNYICNNESINGMATNYYCGAGQGGGAIRIHGDISDPSHHAVIRNNILANNFSGFGGGAVYVINANVEIANNQIVNNSASRCGGITFNNYPSVNLTKAVVKNNLFYHNISITYDPSPSGHPVPGNVDTVDVFSDYADTLIFEHNWVAMPVYHALGLPNTSISPTLLLMGDTTNNIKGTNPALVAPTLTPNLAESALAANFNVQPTSGTINRGTVLGITPGVTDYISNPRIHGSNIDIGAYEYTGTFLGTATIATPQMPMVIYPNPAGNMLHIATPVASGTITLYNITGKQLRSQSITGTDTIIDVQALPAGNYVVCWKNGDDNQVQKVVVE